MKLWKRASGALKDRTSIFASKLSRKTSYRNPDLQVAVIKATSHNEDIVDYKNVQRVFQWLSTSSSYSKPLIGAVSRRMDRTKSWVVALKGLMLIHGALRRKALQNIGRLPFDLSDFVDRRSGLEKVWCFNAFVRSYFSYLDQRFAVAGRERSREARVLKNRLNESISIAQELLRLDELQTLLDKVLRVKPLTCEMMRYNLVKEAMDSLIIEIFQIYGAICDRLARVLVNIYASGRLEAAMALRILKRATVQGHKLSEYFEFCRRYGLMSAVEVPTVVEIPDEDIKELERIINGVPEKIVEMEVERRKDESATVVLKTTVTQKWEVFEEDAKVRNNGGKEQDMIAQVALPDLITF
ncbi:unnamed protein product [Rhodiola kirilowii]